MRQVNIQTAAGKKIWEQYLKRQTGHSDPLRVRRDALTKSVFSKPVSAREAVGRMLTEISRQGDRAVLRYTRLLEKYKTTAAGLKISAAERHSAKKQVPLVLQRALRKAASHIRSFHRAQLGRKPAVVSRPGVRLLERRQPLNRVGIYVPGGVAPLVSTVLMNAIPARVAGVKDVIMATPPGPKGEILSAILYAAELAGVDVIYRLGGATAIGAFAFGTQSITRVDKIVGPANVFGTEAKRQVVGTVGIDSLAGPSEILIIADKTARPEALAWDLLAQGEHGSGAVAILVTPSAKVMALAMKAASGLVKMYPELTTAFQSAIAVKTATLDQAVKLADAYAPEHLSLQIAKPHRLLDKINRAGAVFLGVQTAQAMGDYIAGPNHVLPTNRTACWSSPLSVRDFEHFTSVVTYSDSGMQKEGPAAITIAEAEGLRAHAGSIRVRIQK
ncbi:histidinol dehydrogenase [bacterium]|nr:histidinol dehydrogenase [bacterium]